MAEHTFKSVTLSAEHEPDFSTEVDGNGVRYSEELPGFVTIYANIDGGKVQLARLKAPHIFDAIERGKQAKAAEATDASAAPEATQ